MKNPLIETSVIYMSLQKQKFSKWKNYQFQTCLLQGCVAIISMTWITSVTVFSMLVLPRGGYYFNATGMMACEPFYPRASIRILAACGFYFPTTMILMYCYGSAFHVNKLRLRKSGCNTITGPDDYGGASMEKVRVVYSSSEFNV